MITREEIGKKLISELEALYPQIDAAYSLKYDRQLTAVVKSNVLNNDTNLTTARISCPVCGGETITEKPGYFQYFCSEVVCSHCKTELKHFTNSVPAGYHSHERKLIVFCTETVNNAIGIAKLYIEQQGDYDKSGKIILREPYHIIEGIAAVTEEKAISFEVTGSGINPSPVITRRHFDSIFCGCSDILFYNVSPAPLGILRSSDAFTFLQKIINMHDNYRASNKKKKTAKPKNIQAPPEMKISQHNISELFDIVTRGIATDSISGKRTLEAWCTGCGHVWTGNYELDENVYIVKCPLCGKVSKISKYSNIPSKHCLEIKRDADGVKVIPFSAELTKEWEMKCREENTFSFLIKDNKLIPFFYGKKTLKHPEKYNFSSGKVFVVADPEFLNYGITELKDVNAYDIARYILMCQQNPGLADVVKNSELLKHEIRFELDNIDPGASTEEGVLRLSKELCESIKQDELSIPEAREWYIVCQEITVDEIKWFRQHFIYSRMLQSIKKRSDLKSSEIIMFLKKCAEEQHLSPHFALTVWDDYLEYAKEANVPLTDKDKFPDGLLSKVADMFYLATGETYFV